MKRSFREYCDFFIKDESSYGTVARLISMDKDFPPAGVSFEEICDYLRAAKIYVHCRLACEEMCRKYMQLTA